MPVYFIRAGKDGPIKIGVASSSRSRLQELQTAHSELLILEREVPGDIRVERWFHRRFADSRIRGEWFKFDEMMMTAEPPLIIAADDKVAPRKSRVLIKNDVADAIEALGGATLLAETLGVVYSAVRNWRKANAIPPKHYLAMADISDEKGVTLDRRLFRELLRDRPSA